MSDQYVPTIDDLREVALLGALEAAALAGEELDNAEFLAMFDAGIARYTAEKQADAWDEGFNVGFDAELVRRAEQSVHRDYRVNPYRIEKGANDV